jgi:hypothetical protein
MIVSELIEWLSACEQSATVVIGLDITNDRFTEWEGGWTKALFVEDDQKAFDQEQAEQDPDQYDEEEYEDALESGVKAIVLY